MLLIGRYGFEINQFCKTGEFSQRDNNKTRVYSRRYPKIKLFYVALTRTKNRTYILTPENHPSRFVFELVGKYDLPVERKLVYQPHAGSSLQLYCPVCGSPLKKEYNRNYGLSLYMCTNEPEICDFMANRSDCLKDIHKCRACGKGYMIVKQNRKTGQYFFGCTNWDTKGIRCKNSERVE